MIYLKDYNKEEKRKIADLKSDTSIANKDKVEGKTNIIGRHNNHIILHAREKHKWVYITFSQWLLHKL